MFKAGKVGTLTYGVGPRFGELAFSPSAVSSGGEITGSVLRLFPSVDGKRAYPTEINLRGFPSP